jgi:hypothetical protein
MSSSKKSLETLRKELRYAQDNNLIEYYVDVTRISIRSSTGEQTKHNMTVEYPYFSIRLLPNTPDSKKKRLLKHIEATYEDVNDVRLSTTGASIEIHYDAK